MSGSAPDKNSTEKSQSVVRVTRSAEETFRLAEEMAEAFRCGEVVLLSGGLGAGKTVFTKGLAAGLGVEDTTRVCSPSYTLVNIYEGRFRIFHIDLFRLRGDQEIRDLGWEDFLGEGVVVIEWAEKLVFPPEGIRVMIEQGNDDERTITIRRS
ncbi:MAG: tRNA (adenosine(37)-N6)-threonylcarbamoyltransferase complex ATPase subunit type 1 TsaE [Candidatus Aminicenantes bacterium]|nr:tRNA (adenosine(37)-N6)-threonylcarbamoyltransferase complex ATPase subunit type 1 TsaE [Candidatus Aminicenantes bacterium]